jgi:hypothetical protein
MMGGKSLEGRKAIAGIWPPDPEDGKDGPKHRDVDDDLLLACGEAAERSCGGPGAPAVELHCGYGSPNGGKGEHGRNSVPKVAGTDCKLKLNTIDPSIVSASTEGEHGETWLPLHRTMLSQADGGREWTGSSGFVTCGPGEK